jgi:glycine betaine/proline transport system substrate-binding protein
MKKFGHGIGTMVVLATLFATVANLSAFADTLPGDGKTVRYVQADSLGANYVADQIVAQAMKALGYEVKLTTMNITLFFAAVAQGDVDLSTDVNLPQRDPEFRAVEQQAEIIGTGMIAGGGVNGKAELISCDPGWSCANVVAYQIKQFGIAQNVHVVSGKYEALMADAITRIKSGSPAFFWAWSPSWVTSGLVPGRDVVWLPVPFDALPPKMPNTGSGLIKGIPGCAGGADPCHMAMASWNAGSVTNKAFISANPAIRALIQQIKFSPTVWADWESSINNAPRSSALFAQLADQWLAANKPQFIQWVTTARAAH